MTGTRTRRSKTIATRARSSKSPVLCDKSEGVLERPREKEKEGGDGLIAGSGHEMDIDHLRRETCIGCDKGGKMLVCSVSDCPVAVHQKCFSSKPRLDDKGNFLCPYCWYKHDVTRALEMKKKLMLAKKALSDFMDVEVSVNSDRQKPNDEGNEMAVDRRSVETGAGLGVKETPNEVNTLESREFESHESGGNRREEEILQRDDNSQRINEEIIVGVPLSGSTEGTIISAKRKGNQGRAVEEEEEPADPEVAGTKAPTHDSELSESSNSDTGEPLVRRTCAKQRKTLETHEFENFFDRREEEALRCNDDSRCIDKEIAVGSASTEGTFTSAKCKGNQGRAEEEAHQEAAGTEAPAHDSELSEASNSDTVAVAPLVRRTRAKRMKVDLSKKSSPPPHRTSEKYAGIQKNREISPKRTKKASEPSKPVDVVTFWNEKRKRLFWTVEEENMLKEGVQKYSTLVKKNLPWRKILVFGGHVFHSSRTPSDLKDKWKNMMNEKARTG